MDTPHILLGASALCVKCKRIVVPEVENGTHYPYTGSEITFRDFVQLLTDESWRPKVLPLVKTWAQEVEQLTSVGQRIGPGSPQETTLIKIHCMLQSHPTAQGELYQTAMTLWR
jgi:hypothetical protein